MLTVIPQVLGLSLIRRRSGCHTCFFRALGQLGSDPEIYQMPDRGCADCALLRKDMV
jgi:hypothetical protein